MSHKITLYEHKDFGGRKLVATSAIPNLSNEGFNNTLTSVIVEKGVWILFQHINYEGEIYVVTEGESVQLHLNKWNDKCSSLKPLDDDFSEKPRCRIYQHHRFGGKCLYLTSDTSNLKWYSFNDEVSSIKVYSGAWIAYEHANFEGRQYLFLQGNHNMSSSYGEFKNDEISSLKGIHVPLKPKGPIEVMKIDFDLSSGVLSTTPNVVFKWTQRNDTNVEQALSVSQKTTITKEETYQFNWNLGTSISATAEVSVGLPTIGISGKLGLGVTSSYNVGATRGKKVSNTESWNINYPSKIPPKTTIVLSSTVTKGKMHVPFTAVLRQDERTWTERGMFKGVRFYNFTTAFEELKV